MKRKMTRKLSVVLILLLALAVFGIVAFAWLSSRSVQPEPLVRVDGLQRGEIYFFGPSDTEMRERYGGLDEERTLVLLDGRLKEDPSNIVDLNERFPGGDLYCMAAYFNDIEHIQIDSLPEGSPIVFQYNFYYEDGMFTTVNVYPWAMSVNGTLYTLDYGEEDCGDKAQFVQLLELLFWKLSAGLWPVA